MSNLAQAGDFCPNSAYSDYGKLQDEQQQKIIRFGKIEASRQRYQCKTCKRTFVETKGTIFYRRHTPKDEIILGCRFVRAVLTVDLFRRKVAKPVQGNMQIAVEGTKCI
jgi:hypothetical protein